MMAELPLKDLRVLQAGTSEGAQACCDLLAAQGALLLKADSSVTGGEDVTLRHLLAASDVLVTDTASQDLRNMAEAANPRLVIAVCTNNGSAAAVGVLAALRAAEQTGKGRTVNDQPVTAATSAPARPDTIDSYVADTGVHPLSEGEKRALRDAFGTFATGVTVVTTCQPDGTPRGFTANSFSSVSLDPPLALICIAKTAHSCDTFLAARHFAINVLTEEQKMVSGLFASRTSDKFEEADWHHGTAGMPLLDGALAHLVCLRHKTVDAGDHIILIGRVIDHSARDGKPLGYFRGSYFSVGLEEDLVSAASQIGRVQVGAVLARGQQILLRQGKGGSISVPKLEAESQSLHELKRHLEKLGVRAELDFLYAVFNDTLTGRHAIFFHGTAVGYAPVDHKFFDLDAIPFDKCESHAERSMLERYCREFEHGSFGVYQGDDSSGVVQHVNRDV